MRRYLLVRSLFDCSFRSFAPSGASVTARHAHIVVLRRRESKKHSRKKNGKRTHTPIQGADGECLSEASATDIPNTFSFLSLLSQPSLPVTRVLARSTSLVSLINVRAHQVNLCVTCYDTAAVHGSFSFTSLMIILTLGHVARRRTASGAEVPLNRAAETSTHDPCRFARRMRYGR